MVGRMLTPAEVLARIPQQEPFRFVDEILELDDEHVVAALPLAAGRRLLPRPLPGQPGHARRAPGRVAWPRRAWSRSAIYLLRPGAPEDEAAKILTVLHRCERRVHGHRARPATRVRMESQKRVLPAAQAPHRRRDDARGRHASSARATLSGHGGAAMRRRVVVTGLGVVAPNGDRRRRRSSAALREGRSRPRARARRWPSSASRCQVAGVPQGVDALAEKQLRRGRAPARDEREPPLRARSPRSRPGSDAGLARPAPGDDARRLGHAARSSAPASAAWTRSRERVVPLVDAKKVRRLGSTAVEQVMASGISARVSGLLALGNQVTTNSSACSTGTEAVAEGVCAHPRTASRSACCAAAPRARATTSGRASTRCACCAQSSNDEPERGVAADVRVGRRLRPRRRAPACCCSRASRARCARGARIRAEVLGVARQLRRPPRRRQHDRAEPDGRRSAASAAALDDAGARRRATVDAINGHLTATGADPREVARRGRARSAARPATFPRDHRHEVADRPRARRRRRIECVGRAC